MPLNLPRRSSGEFLDRISYDATAGRLYRHDRDTGPTRRRFKTDITESFEAVFDLEHAETGWIAFGDRPDFVMGPADAPAFPKQPSDEHRPGFRVVLFNDDIETREFSSTAGCVLDSFDELYAAYEAAKDKPKNRDKLPLVALAGTTVFSIRGQDLYRPEWVIRSWVTQPDALRHVPARPATVTPLASRHRDATRAAELAGRSPAADERIPEELDDSIPF